MVIDIGDLGLGLGLNYFSVVFEVT